MQVNPLRQRLPWWLLLGASLVVGTFLRIWQLGIQIPVDDEWHAIHKLLHADMLNIATHFGRADYCIPLTLYYRALYDLGWLSDWLLRLPLLIAGLALLLVPLCMRRLSLPTRAIWTGLLALSPVLIYLSRTARPYALTCLLTGFAVVAFYRWWQGGSKTTRWAWGYAVATVLAAWLNLLTLTFSVLPFVWFGVPALYRWARGGSGRPVWRLLALGLATLLPLLVLLLPPLIGDWHAMRVKAAVGEMNWYAGWRTLLMALGTASYWPVPVLLALTLWGAWRLARRYGAWLSYLCFTAAGGLVIIIGAEPAWIQHPAVLMRYAIGVLPLLLLLLASGLAGLVRVLRWPSLGGLLTITLLVMVFRTGPLPFQLYWPNQFMAHALFQFDANPFYTRNVIGYRLSRPIPRFYERLAVLPPGSVTVGEGPWRLESALDPLPWFQRHDRQLRKIVMTVPLCSHHEWGEYRPDRHGIHLREMVHLQDILSGQDGGLDFLVLHLEPRTLALPDPPWPDMQQCLARVEQALGPPIYQDARIAAFDLRKGPR